jgi:hypothetical protein
LNHVLDFSINRAPASRTTTFALGPTRVQGAWASLMFLGFALNCWTVF